MKCPGCNKTVKNNECKPCRAVFLSLSQALKEENKRPKDKGLLSIVINRRELKNARGK
jgi:hypothetical protein